MTERSESERAELLALADRLGAVKQAAYLLERDAKKIASALRRLAAPDHGGADAGVGVKPLEWISCEDGTYHDIECQYEIQPIGKFFRLVRGVTGGSPYICDARSVLAAKTEAKLDYERRIHSTLSKPAPVAANASAEARLREVAKIVAIWLRGALDCTSFSWDGDQWDAADESYRDLMEALSTHPHASDCDKQGER